MMMMMGDVVC